MDQLRNGKINKLRFEKNLSLYGRGSFFVLGFSLLRISEFFVIRKMEMSETKLDIRDILKQLCSYKGVEIIEGHIMPDHIHILVSIPPKMSVSSFMGYLKGKSALMIFDRHANLKYKFGNRHFWSEGYYVSTVGLNEAAIKKYIQDQENYDIMQDKLSVKEYEDPFKGTESK